MKIIWCMVPQMCNVDIWTIFLRLTPLTTQKIKILKTCKKHLEISFYTSVPQIMTICYTFSEIWCVKDAVMFHFGHFYQNLKENEKKSLEVPSFYKSVPKIMTIWITVPDIWHTTDVIVIFHFGLFFALLPS